MRGEEDLLKRVGPKKCKKKVKMAGSDAGETKRPA